jgi:hypothetical protein
VSGHGSPPRADTTSASGTRTVHEEEAVYPSRDDSLTEPTEAVVAMFGTLPIPFSLICWAQRSAALMCQLGGKSSGSA